MSGEPLRKIGAGTLGHRLFARNRFRLALGFAAMFIARILPVFGEWREEPEIDVHRLEAARRSLLVSADMTERDVDPYGIVPYERTWHLIGYCHLRQTVRVFKVDRIRSIEAVSKVPLVIHGGSGVPIEQRRHLARTSHICKFNIGTELRMAFGDALRKAVERDRSRFDRLEILRETHDPVMLAARRAIASMAHEA